MRTGQCNLPLHNDDKLAETLLNGDSCYTAALKAQITLPVGMARCHPGAIKKAL